MKVLAVCRPVDGSDGGRFASLVAEEAAALRRLRDSGTLLEGWSPGRPGAILILEVTDLPAASQVVAQLPLARAGLITTELSPLHDLAL